jgi:deazaflavin-dependent oxidoreductase (nitroreductase family)
MGSIIKALTRVINPLAMRLAASGLLSVWGVVHHTGRRSGRAFSTPIALGANADYFFVPLPWGPGTDWCRNLVAANGGGIRYRGRDYVVSDPQVVSLEVARPAFPGPVRLILPGVGIKRFLRLRRGALSQRAA